MEMPTILKILGHKYRIKETDRLIHTDSTVGTCCCNTCEIRINGDPTPESRKSEALLHEIIEALNYHLELDMEHNVIASLGEGLFTVLRDNNLNLGE